jgi:hypothetical protein
MGVEKNPAAGFGYLKRAYAKSEAKGTLDPWAVYFLKECYLRGNGTPVDTAMAAQLDTCLRTTPGRNVYTVIGADTKSLSAGEVHERLMRGLSPKTKQVPVCAGAPSYQCHQETRIVDDNE